MPEWWERSYFAVLERRRVNAGAAGGWKVPLETSSLPTTHTFSLQIAVPEAATGSPRSGASVRRAAREGLDSASSSITGCMVWGIIISGLLI